jgi:hypothetical protein
MRGRWTDHLQGSFRLTLPHHIQAHIRLEERWGTLTPEDLPLEILTYKDSDNIIEGLYAEACKNALQEGEH